MAAVKSHSIPLLTLFTLFLLTNPLPTHSFLLNSYHTLFSLSHSLMTRVADLRASRGDIAGSARARGIAEKIESGMGLSFWGVMWSMGWDYLKNYAWNWRDMSSSVEMFGAMADLKQLVGAVSELTRLKSEAERVAWVQRKYSSILAVSKSLFGRLLRVFSRGGPLKEVIQTVQSEVLQGDLLRDCLELGSNDLKGLIQALNDITQQFSSTTSESEL